MVVVENLIRYRGYWWSPAQMTPRNPVHVIRGWLLAPRGPDPRAAHAEDASTARTGADL